jgi:hypothetical protein
MMKTDTDSEAFLEYIGKRLSENPRASHSGKHRAAFTALRTLIEAALAQGYTMRATWSALREKKQLSMSYETFRTHCRRAGMRQAVQTAAPAMRTRSEPPRPASSAAARLGTVGPADPTERGFRHERVPRKKDIYG